MYDQYMLGTPYLKQAVPNMDSIAGAKEYHIKNTGKGKNTTSN